MSKINFPKKQEQRLIPKHLLEYAEELQENHPDPSAEWGGSGGGTPIEAGEGIVITGTDTKTISVDTETIPTVAELSTVAFSGSYSDLSNKPDLSVYELKTDAFSGNYNDLTNKPTIPDAVSGTNDGTNWTSLTIGSDTYGLASGSTPSNMVTTNTAQTITGKKTFSNYSDNPIVVAGSYGMKCESGNNSSYLTPSELTVNGGFINPKKIIVDSDNITFNNTSNGYSAHIQSPAANLSADVTYALPTTSGTVALTSDIITSYNDLTDKPTIPTVGNGTITIKKNNTTVDTFTTNQSANKSINITVPTKTSDLTNDSGFITGIDSSDVITALGYTPGTSNFDGAYNSLTGKPDLSIYAQSANLATVATTGAYSDLTGTPTIPTDTSDLTNGAGFITSSALSGYATETWVGNQGYLTSVSWSDVSNKPTFATVATSGDYDDLLNKPTIPTVPTNVSAFTNDAGYITNSVNNLTNYTLSSALATVATSGSYSDLSNKPTIPTYTTLFSTTPVSGTTVYSIELSDNVANYDELIIYYYRHNSIVTKASFRLDSPTVGDLFYLVIYETTTNPRLYTKADQFTITDATHINIVNAVQQRVGNNESTNTTLTTTEMRSKPYKIVGVKY